METYDFLSLKTSDVLCRDVLCMETPDVLSLEMSDVLCEDVPFMETSDVLFEDVLWPEMSLVLCPETSDVYAETFCMQKLKKYFMHVRFESKTIVPFLYKMTRFFLCVSIQV